MTNAIKYSLALGISLVSLTSFYFFVIYLPTINRERMLVSQMERCTQMGSEKFQEEQSLSNPSSVVYLNPQYKYNSDQQACLYKGGSISGSMIEEHIVDLFTNTEVAWYVAHASERTKEEAAAVQEYKTKEAELFGNE